MKFAAPCSALVLTILWHSFPAGAETLIVKLSGIRGRAGVVRVMIWKEAAGFPTRPEKALAQKSRPVTGPESELSFAGLAPGTYAVAGYVDENNNGIMDRSIFGWPTEQVAASNGASGLMGPPNFAAASFELRQPTQSIPLKFK